MKTKIKNVLMASISIIALAGCQYEELNRSEFMSASSGNAMAQNSALQVIDPWPGNASNNNLAVPSVKYGGEPKKSAAAPTPIIIQTGGGAKQ